MIGADDLATGEWECREILEIRGTDFDRLVKPYLDGEIPLPLLMTRGRLLQCPSEILGRRECDDRFGEIDYTIQAIPLDPVTAFLSLERKLVQIRIYERGLSDSYAPFATRAGFARPLNTALVGGQIPHNRLSVLIHRDLETGLDSACFRGLFLRDRRPAGSGVMAPHTVDLLSEEGSREEVRGRTMEYYRTALERHGRILGGTLAWIFKPSATSSVNGTRDIEFVPPGTPDEYASIAPPSPKFIRPLIQQAADHYRSKVEGSWPLER